MWEPRVAESRRSCTRSATVSDHRVRFTLNGIAHDETVPAEMLLIELIRDRCALTGTKEGCSVGVCGACSVLVDGALLSACLVPAVHVDGREVTTVEGLAREDGTLTPLQERFIVDGGFQCGICTPGQLIAATALLAETPHPEEREIRDWMMGNLCRCTGYRGIIAAIRSAST